MIKKKTLTILVCFQFIFNSCSVNNTPIETTVSLTNTVATPLETHKANSNENICVEFSEVFPERVQLFGKLVVYRQHENYLLDLTDNTYLPFTGKISPSGDKLAIYEYGKWLQITDLSNNVLSTFSWNPRWTEANETLFGNMAETDSLFYGWRDNDAIGIPTLPVGSLFTLNTLTEETREITFPYSNEVWAFGGAIDIRDNYVSFSPDFEKVIYASTMSLLVLRNNLIYPDGTWRTVAWVGFSHTYTNPNWSPDSSTFIFVMDTNENIQSMPIDNLFQVSADFGVGEKQLTDLGHLFNNPHQIWISQFDWSPDGEKIALVANVTQNEGDKSLSRLLVLDVETGNIEDYCNPDPDTPYTSDSFSFTWSPDGKYIATDTTIVDLVSRIVYKFPDLYIVDWVGEGKSP